MTGEGVAKSEIAEVKREVQGVPVFANTGVRIDTVEEIFKVADGCVIGTHLKVDGDTWNRVDSGRVTRFMDKVRSIR
jgi:hypothetical protein